MHKLSLLYTTSILLFLIVGCSSQKTKNTYFKRGVVVSAHPEASRVGLDILKQGGNAIDAAIAVQFALAVVYPNAGNIGGGGFLVYRDAKGNSTTLDYREKAPNTASRDMYLDVEGNVVPKKSVQGHLAAGVPGTVDGMVQAHQKFGKLPWSTLLEPAIQLAKKGFVITANQAKEFNDMKSLFRQFNPDGAALLKAKGDWRKGEKLVQTELANTLTLIRDKGRAGFYEGEVAEQIIKEMNRGNGIMSKNDLATYKALWRKPIISKYKVYKVITMPPPSSGGIALTQLLNAIEKEPLAKWGHNQDSTVRLIVEAERRVYADRATYLGDPDFYKVPQEKLLEKKYQEHRMHSMNWDRATPSGEIKAGVFSGKESEETTHYSIADKDGNAVAVTTTLNNSYGSLVFVKGAGFLLNNEMDDFSVKPGTPNSYGLVGGEANAIAPGKRMLSSMTPTIIEKDGKLFMVVGTPGGSTIITSVFQTILNVIEFKQGIQEAVTAKRFHHQWLPDEVYIEPKTFDEKNTSILKAKGYKLVERPYIGLVDAVLVTPRGYQGGADPRGDDTTAGW
ncbi:gamma-glutamyltransferase [Pedobacter sp. ASV28]|uniref:gamma-glutamyltransferase n=1 Tax=Pedobacter sp. ASV28 TaxID=2795123 RepID=UPI0018EC5B86|nr:gamma-glutamyltransferase [Pedobacter sp. ASV28]